MPNTPGIKVELRCVVYKNSGIWFAHCLEFDIVAEGETPQEAIESVISLCQFQLEEACDRDDISSVFHQAPPEYWEMYFSGKRSTVERHPTKFLEEFVSRELAEV